MSYILNLVILCGIVSVKIGACMSYILNLVILCDIASVEIWPV